MRDLAISEEKKPRFTIHRLPAKHRMFRITTPYIVLTYELHTCKTFVCIGQMAVVNLVFTISHRTTFQALRVNQMEQS
jgi:hypothetical protein